MRRENNRPNRDGRDADWDAAASETEEDLSAVPVAMADLEQVYARYIGTIYRFLYARVGNREDAEDLASETFLKASHQLDLCRSEASIATWLFAVARTVLADHWRKYYRYGVLLPFDELHVDSSNETATPPAGRSDIERLVANTLELLPQRYRRVLELRFLRGYSVLETAQELGVTPANAKVVQHRALAKAARCGSEVPSLSPVPSPPPPPSREPGYPDPAP